MDALALLSSLDDQANLTREAAALAEVLESYLDPARFGRGRGNPETAFLVAGVLRRHLADLEADAHRAGQKATRVPA